MTRMLLFAAVLVILVPATAGQSFNFGVTPTSIDAGTKDPGTTFYGEFRVLSSSEDNISIGLNAEPGGRVAAGEVGVPLHQFSAQPCPCTTFLEGGGTIPRRSRSLAVYGGVDRWQTVTFLVDVPQDAEPGYHLIEVAPRPTVGGGDGGVGLVSTATLPVVFRVPGRVERSGQVLGIRQGREIRDRQEVIITFYNRGTVTMAVQHRLKIVGNRTETLTSDTRLVPPGETADIPVAVPLTLMDAAESVTAVADYGTGAATATVALPLQSELPSPGPITVPTPYLLLLTVFTAVTVWVVRRA